MQALFKHIVLLTGNDIAVLILGESGVGKELVAHFVIEGEKGPVTVLVMPDESIQDTMYVDSKQLRGIVLPLAKNQGSIAVVGYLGESIKKIANKAVDSFELSI